MRLSDRSGKWRRGFLFLPARVHTGKRKNGYNPYGPNAEWEWRWLEEVEYRPCTQAYDGASVGSMYIYRSPATVKQEEQTESPQAS